MAVTYAWRIDSGLYSYIVNNNCLDDTGILKSVTDYLETPDARYPELNEAIQDALKREEPDTAQVLYQDVYMGSLETRKLTEKEEEKLRIFSKIKWGAKNDLSLESYTKYFESMMDKIHAFNPNNTETKPYAYVDLLSPEKYFNVDNECSNLEGKPGQSALIDSVSSIVYQGDTEMPDMLNIEMKINDRTYSRNSADTKIEGYTYEEIIGIFGEAWLNRHTANEFSQVDPVTGEYTSDEVFHDYPNDSKYFNTAGEMIYSSELIDAWTYVHNTDTNKYYIKRDTNENDNRYSLKFELTLPEATEAHYDPTGETVSEINRVSLTTVMPFSVGAIPSGTTAGQLAGLTFSEILNMMFFPDISPKPATKPGLSISVSYPDGTSLIFDEADGVAEFNTRYISNAIVGYTSQEGHFNGDGYEINKAIYEAETPRITATPTAITTLNGGLNRLTWRCEQDYTAPTNKPKTSRGIDYDGSGATWVASAATASKNVDVYVVRAMETNFQSFLAPTEELFKNTYVIDENKLDVGGAGYSILPFSGNQKEFIVKMPSIGIDDTIPLRFSISGTELEKIEFWNDISKIWDMQYKNNQYLIEDNIVSYNKWLGGYYKITLKTPLQ